MPLYYWLLPLAAYLYGSVPFGFLAALWLRGVDIRETGSGNIGATNAARVLGFRYFPLIFLLDFSKGFLWTLAAGALAASAGGAAAHDPPLFVVLTGLAAILGHVFPVYLGFKGGKAVAASAGFFVVLAPWAVLAAAAVWAVVFAAFRYVSLASISAAVALPAAVLVLREDRLGEAIYLTAVAVAGGLFVVWLHRGNVRRLLAGTEQRVGRGHCGPKEETEQ